MLKYFSWGLVLLIDFITQKISVAFEWRNILYRNGNISIEAFYWGVFYSWYHSQHLYNSMKIISINEESYKKLWFINIYYLSVMFYLWGSVMIFLPSLIFFIILFTLQDQANMAVVGKLNIRLISNINNYLPKIKGFLFHLSFSLLSLSYLSIPFTPPHLKTV